METQPTPEPIQTKREKAFEFFKHLIFIEAPPDFVSDHYIPEHYKKEQS